MSRTSFDPAVHGFYFVNTFRNYFSPGITTEGRCGGMAYGALDFFYAGAPVPQPVKPDVTGIDLCARTEDRLDLFARAADGGVIHRWYWRNGWGDWASLGGQISSDPSTVSWGEGHMSVFARGMDGALWHRQWIAGQWHDWESLGGEIIDGPDACSWGPGRIDVFVRGMDNALWHKAYDGKWGDWESLGGELSSDPSAVASDVGRIDVFALDINRGMVQRPYAGRWHNWVDLGGSFTSAPDACSDAPGRLNVYGRGEDGAVWENRFNNGWSNWNRIDSLMMGNPTATSWGFNHAELAVMGTDGEIYRQRHLNGSNGHGWVSVSHDLPGDGTPLEAFLYRRQITSLVNMGPGFFSRHNAFWNDDRAKFRWGIEEQHEFGKVRRHIDARRPMPIGMLAMPPNKDHQVVVIGYDTGATERDLRIHLYDPNFPGVMTTLVPDLESNCFRQERHGEEVKRWRTYFVDEAYSAVQPYQ